MSEHRAYVGVGTNLGNRLANLDRAVTALECLGVVAARSSLYRTVPWGERNQPWFLNAVVLLATELTPQALLERLQEIETELGRKRGARWGPRLIDLDLLLYDDLEMITDGLQIPHPRLRERAFVLAPLAELDERFTASRDALSETERAGVMRVERESVAAMPENGLRSASERVRALAQFLAETDAVRVRVKHGDDAIEVIAETRGTRHSRRAGSESKSAEPAQRMDTIRADLVGIFHAGRPAPVAGELLEVDRELGYIEALGIRTPVHSMGGGRLVSVAAADGTPVEYGQALFTVARTR